MHHMTSETSPVLQISRDVTCPVCACLCDDLELAVDGERIVRAERACVLSEPWFLQQGLHQPPVAEIEGQPVSLETAIQRAATLLQESRAPLVYGLSRSSTEGQSQAVRLADLLGATIDTTASLGHGSSVMAVQAVGESTCTLGEARNRADLVIFWGVNPVVTHPRHFERYSVDAIGEFIPRGRADRRVVVIDAERTETSDLADLFLQVEQGRDFEAICTVRLLLRGLEPEPGTVTGLPLPALRQLAEEMRGCRYGVVFFGFGLSRSPLAHRTVEALLRLVTDLNAITRFCARRVRGSGDVTGADTVLAWQTGYPFSVNLGRGYPRYNPGEFTALNLLERQEVDACLFVGSQGVKRFSAAGRAELQKIPTIFLDAPMAELPFTPTVRFTTAVYGVHVRGTAYRMDEIPIPLTACLPQHYPSDADVLQQLISKLTTLRSASPPSNGPAPRE